MIRVNASQLPELVRELGLHLTDSGAPIHPFAAVDLTESPDRVDTAAVELAASTAGMVLIGVADSGLDPRWLPVVDALSCTLVSGNAVSPSMVPVAETERELASLSAAVTRSPRASLTLDRVLRANADLDVPNGIAVESAAYSMLLAGAEFKAWLATRRLKPRPQAGGPAVLVSRAQSTLSITLNRPEQHNAFSRHVRDGLIEGLELVACDASIKQVILNGAGPSFCSGGDLAEFGTSQDVSTAHLVRLDRSAALRVHRVRQRITAVLHGACIGAGIEIPSFADRVEAREGTFFLLPEISMGLVPGAGGTVGITRRIGRWRTAYLCLSGVRLPLDAALDWKLVDGRAGA